MTPSSQFRITPRTFWREVLTNWHQLILRRIVFIDDLVPRNSLKSFSMKESLSICFKSYRSGKGNE
jgi:hypothetical protein